MYVNTEEGKGTITYGHVVGPICASPARQRVKGNYYNCPQTVCHQANRLHNEPLQVRPRKVTTALLK
jgi:hypothetical protein